MEKPITQQAPAGCAVACVASLLGTNYKNALSLFRDGKNRHFTSGFYNSDILEVLGKKNMKGVAKHITKTSPGDIYKEGTIVFMKRGGKYPIGHYLLRKDNQWMDPWINFPNINPAKAGFRKRLPAEVQYVIATKVLIA